jgi:hypothetical protein
LWKWLCHQKQSTCSMQSPSKFQWHLITKIENGVLKFTWKHKRPQIANAILSRKTNADFKLYYRVIAIKIAENWNLIHISHPVTISIQVS